VLAKMPGIFACNFPMNAQKVPVLSPTIKPTCSTPATYQAIDNSLFVHHEAIFEFTMMVIWKSLKAGKFLLLYDPSSSKRRKTC
jgi:hypothetical protein